LWQQGYLLLRFFGFIWTFYAHCREKVATVSSHTERSHTKPPRILVIEDEGLVALNVKNSLQSMGYDVCGIAASGEAALEKAAHDRPELALIDIKLRGTYDGIETAQLLRQKFGTAAIFLTAHSDSATIERAKFTEPLGYIIKPFSLKELRGAIEIGLYKNTIERRLRENEEQLANILGCLADAIFSCSSNGVIRYANPAATNLLGLPTEGFLGRSLLDVCQLYHSVTREPVDFFLESLQTDTSTAHPPTVLANCLECVLRLSDSEERVVEVTTTSIREPKTSEQGTLFVIRDMTLQKQTYEQQRALETQLYRAQKMQAIGQLAGGIAHDFNNLLTAIMGNLGLLRVKITDPEVTERVEATQQACARAAELVGKLLTFSRKAPEQFSQVCVRSIVDEAISIAESTFPAEITIEKSYPQYSFSVYADANQLHQVILNLLLNARDAVKEKLCQQTNERGHVVINLGRVKASRFKGRLSVNHTDPEDFIVLTVSDNGTGMSNTVKQHLFEPFFTTKEVGSGTGLGMSVVYGIVNRLHGWIEIASVEDRGSSLVIYLPASQPQTDKVSPAIGSGLKTQVLVISDDQLLQDLLSSRIREFHYQPLAARSPQHGLDQLKEKTHLVRLVILDSDTSRQPQQELLNLLKSVEPGVKVLFLSDTPNTPVVPSVWKHDKNQCVIIPKPPHPDSTGELNRHIIALTT
jgi:two-component system, cell cycle sensor histidine kinase and response regulator CckA